MTSQEIKQRLEWLDDHATSQGEYDPVPIWEIAYQLAVMNERQDVPKLKHNPFGESLARHIRQGSESEVRHGDVLMAHCPKCGSTPVSRLAVGLIRQCNAGELILKCSDCGAVLEFRYQLLDPPTPENAALWNKIQGERSVKP